MAQNFPTREYSFFNGGLNLREQDELELQRNETPDMQNFTINASGLSKTGGLESVDDLFPDYFQFRNKMQYRRPDGLFRFIDVSYPDIVSIDPLDSTFEFISNPTGGRYTGWKNDGDPTGVRVGDFIGITDGANPPVLIGDNKAYEIPWPFTYSDNNKDPDNLGDSYLAPSANPTDIPFPTVSFFYKNRWWVAVGRALFVSQVNAFSLSNTTAFNTIFSSNNAADTNIAFFVEPPEITSPIVGARVLGENEVIIFTEDSIVRLRGNNPPSLGYAAPFFDFDTLSDSVGAVAPRLIANKGDNDVYFVTNKKTVYIASKIEESLQVKPFGISDKIFPAFEDLTLDTLKRGFLANHRLLGELYFFVPTNNKKVYPNAAYILNYEDGEDPNRTWTKLAEFDNLNISSATEIDIDSEFYVSTENKLLQANSGFSFDGDPIRSFYAFPGDDFDKPKNKKRIHDITIYGTTSTGATLQFFHLWENGEGSNTTVFVPANVESKYGEAIYGVSVYTSKAGTPFGETPFEIKDRVGKVLKLAMQNTSDSQDFTLHKLVIRFEYLGQRN